MRFQSPRGTEDVLPTEAFRWQHLEKAFQSLAESYGYLEIRTPTFEDTELFTRSAGETSDIATKEMYEFKDKAGRSLSLKPEGTAGVMRSLIEHGLCPPGTVGRYYYITPIFRYERPQKGRLREAHQLGLELVGSANPIADSEVIEITVEFYKAVGLTDVEVSLNSIGRSGCREEFRRAVMEQVSPFLETQSEEFRSRVQKNPLRLLDSKDPEVKAALSGLPPITEFLEPDSANNLAVLRQILDERRIPYRLNPTIVRGLDYYTDTVFEITSSRLGSQDSLCGGGRYDGLMEQLGGKPTPCVGVGIGIERALIVLQDIDAAFVSKRPDVFLAVPVASARQEAQRVASKLRSRGLSVIVDPDPERSLKSQLRQADRARARFAVIVGDDEVSRGVMLVRTLDDGSQSEVELGAVEPFLKAE
jgi:histidyl-tRNA synthetase